MNHHDLGSHRYSALDIINKTNAKNLKLAFALPLGGTSGNEYLEVDPGGGRRLHVRHRRVERRLQDRRPLRHRRPHPVEDGPRHPEAGPQPRRRAVGQLRHLGDRSRRARDRDRQGDRQGRVGQEPARPARPRDHRGAARAQGRDHRRRLRRRQRRARLDRVARSEDRRGAVEDLRHPGARRARQRDLEGQEQRLAHRRRRHVRHRLLRSRDQPHLLGHRQSGAALRLRASVPATICSPTRPSPST